jgi:hypothetical protein
MLALELYPAPHPQVAGRMIDGEAVVILAEANEVNVFNAVGSRVWELADGTHTLAEIVAIVVKEYDVTLEKATADVVAFVEQLVAERVLELSGERVPPVADEVAGPAPPARGVKGSGA